MPPAPYNFASVPRIETRHPLWDDPTLPDTIAEGRHDLADYAHGRRETWGTDSLTGRAQEVIFLPSNSWLPLLTALILAVVCISLLVKWYPLAAVAAIVAAGFLLRWSWMNGGRLLGRTGTEDPPGRPPLHPRTLSSPGLWGMGIAMLANGSLFLSLLFGWFYLWSVAPQWSMPESSPLSLPWMLVAGLAFSAATVWLEFLVHGLRRRKDSGLAVGFFGITALGALQIAALTLVILQAPLYPRETSHDAALLVTLLYVLLHTSLATILALLQGLRVGYGHVSRHAPYEPVVVGAFWRYSLVIFWLAFGATLFLPTLLGGSS